MAENFPLIQTVKPKSKGKMMELSSSAITGALRVGVQVVSAHKRPVIEVYHQVYNRFGPEHEFTVGNGQPSLKHRFQDIFTQFLIVNIGGERAENININIKGDFKRNTPRREFRGLFLPQMAPGQVHYLFRLDQTDLQEYEYKGNVGTPIGLKKSSFTIALEYDAPRSVINSILSIPSKIKKKQRFNSNYTFSPTMIDGDLPPAEYAP